MEMTRLTPKTQLLYIKKYDLNKLPKEQTFQMDLECDGEDK